MHKKKLLKLLGISLIVGILGLTGFCKKSKDNIYLALGAGLGGAHQQAEQSANNTENPQWFCAHVIKNSNNNYSATLTPLVPGDCDVSYWGNSNDAFKQRLLETIDGDLDLSANCPNTRDYISGLDTSSTPEKFIYVNGRSLLSEVGLSTPYTVVSPNTYKLVTLLGKISYYASMQSNPEKTNCQNAVQSKINSLPDSNKFCSNLLDTTLGLPACNNSMGKTKAVLAKCNYGSSASSPICATLIDLF